MDEGWGEKHREPMVDIVMWQCGDVPVCPVALFGPAGSLSSGKGRASSSSKQRVKRLAPSSRRNGHGAYETCKACRSLAANQPFVWVSETDHTSSLNVQEGERPRQSRSNTGQSER